MSKEIDFYWVHITHGPPFSIAIVNKPQVSLSDLYGAYNTDGAKTTYKCYEDLPKWLRKKLSLLLTVGNTTIIEGVGQRIGEFNFLIYK